MHRRRRGELRHYHQPWLIVWLFWHCSSDDQQQTTVQLCVSYKKLSCRREAARRSMSLETLLSHSRWFEITPLNNAYVSYYILTVYLSCTFSDIFNVELWRALEIWVRVRSVSLKVAPFNRSHIAQKLLLTFHSNYGPVLYHFRDKTKYWSLRDSLRNSEYYHDRMVRKIRMVGLPDDEKRLRIH